MHVKHSANLCHFSILCSIVSSHTSLSFTSMACLPIEAKKKFIVMLAISAHVSQLSVALAVTVISQSKMLSVERYEGMLAKGSGTAIWSIQTSPWIRSPRHKSTCMDGTTTQTGMAYSFSPSHCGYLVPHAARQSPALLSGKSHDQGM